MPHLLEDDASSAAIVTVDAVVSIPSPPKTKPSPKLISKLFELSSPKVIGKSPVGNVIEPPNEVDVPFIVIV